MTTLSARDAFEPAYDFVRQHLTTTDFVGAGRAGHEAHTDHAGHAASTDRPVSAGSRRYRLEHSVRVARIGWQVAEAAGLDPDVLALGCLLHDVGKYDAPFPVDHGRAGALLADDFLREVGVADTVRHDITQGIAMHTDGLWNPRTDGDGGSTDRTGRPYLFFPGEPSILAQSIGDCDNIDRFGAYRVADTLRYVKFLELSTSEQRSWLADYLEKLTKLYSYQCATDAATALWHEALGVQQAFFTRLATEIGPER